MALAGRAHGDHDEHAPVLLGDEQAAALRLRQAEVMGTAVADLVHGPPMRVPEVVAEHRRRAGEGAARLRAAARRAGALALVVAALVVGDVGLAAVRGEGAEDPVPADDVFQSGVAAVGRRRRRARTRSTCPLGAGHGSCCKPSARHRTAQINSSSHENATKNKQRIYRCSWCR